MPTDTRQELGRKVSTPHGGLATYEERLRKLLKN